MNQQRIKQTRISRTYFIVEQVHRKENQTAAEYNFFQELCKTKQEQNRNKTGNTHESFIGKTQRKKRDEITISEGYQTEKQ